MIGNLGNRRVATNRDHIGAFAVTKGKRSESRRLAYWFTILHRRTTMFKARFWLAFGAFAVFALLTVVGARSAVAQSECAHYISGGADYMGNGSLLGWKQVTVTKTKGGGISVTVGKKGAGGGGNLGGGSTTSETFNVGTYRLSSGGDIEVRCDNYERWFGF